MVEVLIVKYDLEGKVVWQNTEEDYSYDGIAAVEDGIIVISVSGIVEKYDLEGNIAWENTEKRYTYKGSNSSRRWNNSCRI